MKKFFACFVLVALLTLQVFDMPAFAIGEELYKAQEVTKILAKTDLNDLKAKAAVLMDINTGAVLYQKNPHDKLPIASVTKVMALLLAMEAIDSGKLSMDDTITITDHAASITGSKVWLTAGDEITVRDLIKTIAVNSANDSTVAIAEKLGGSESGFVEIMNEKAKQLGMIDTHFLDAAGLSDEGMSSAYDVALMSRELMLKHPSITEFTTIWHEPKQKIGKNLVDLDNKNKLLKLYNGANGLKTGSTTKAGQNLAATAKRDSKYLVSVVLGEPDTNVRFAETMKLLDHGFNNFLTVNVNKKGDFIKAAEVKKGFQKEVNGICSRDVNFLVDKANKDKITKEVVMNETLNAPIKAGAKVGEIIYKVDGKEIGKAEIQAEKDVKKASFLRLFFRMILEWFGIGRS